ncbi:MAG: glycosyltransferase family 4 protein [Desulfocapsa sp.]|nr:glycosyltransferase family 4 protein [Desulfocapsa sp.]
MTSKKIAVLAVASASGEQGGAENFYRALTQALNDAGAQAEQLNILGDESNYEAIEETYLRFYDLDLSSYDGVISTKAPAYVVRHPNHITYLTHTIRAFYDMFDTVFSHITPQLLQQRELIQKLDTDALTFPRTKKVFVIGHEVRNRLLHYIKIDSEVLHISLMAEVFRCGQYDDYLFIPGRLHRWKRIDLLIESMQHVKAPLKLKIAGTGQHEEEYKELAAADGRVEFLGRVSDEELVNLYSNALAVPFVPIREDFGLVTIEAFRSGKPVLTCSDSGEPTYFVQDGDNGFVCDPDPRAIAEKLDFFYNNKKKTREMGMYGKKSVEDLRWENISTKLLKALGMDCE